MIKKSVVFAKTKHTARKNFLKDHPDVEILQIARNRETVVLGNKQWHIFYRRAGEID